MARLHAWSPPGPDDPDRRRGPSPHPPALAHSLPVHNYGRVRTDCGISRTTPDSRFPTTVASGAGAKPQSGICALLQSRRFSEVINKQVVSLVHTHGMQVRQVRLEPPPDVHGDILRRG